MNSRNSKVFDPLRHLDLKIDFKRSDKYVTLSYLSIRYALETIKKFYKNNKFEISAPTRNDKCELPDGSYFVSDI